MDEADRPPSLDQLEKRIEAARERNRAHGRGATDKDGEAGPGRSQASGLALAWRIISELVAGVAVGVGIGWLLDRWLDTRPWLMVTFLFLGMAAGCYNVFRVAQGYEAAMGYRRPPNDEDKG